MAQGADCSVPLALGGHLETGLLGFDGPRSLLIPRIAYSEGQMGTSHRVSEDETISPSSPSTII